MAKSVYNDARNHIERRLRTSVHGWLLLKITCIVESDRRDDNKKSTTPWNRMPDFFFIRCILYFFNANFGMNAMIYGHFTGQTHQRTREQWQTNTYTSMHKIVNHNRNRRNKNDISSVKISGSRKKSSVYNENNERQHQLLMIYKIKKNALRREREWKMLSATFVCLVEVKTTTNEIPIPACKMLK